jgi:hypothetical protein
VSAKVREATLARLEKEPAIVAIFGGDGASVRGRVMFTATHTHSAPGNSACGPAEAVVLGRYRDDVVAAIGDALVGAALDALADLAPAEVAVGRTAAPRFVRNRYWSREHGFVPAFAVGNDATPPPPGALDADPSVVEVDADLTVLRFRAPLPPRADPATWKPPLRGLVTVFGAHATVIGMNVPHVSSDWPGAFAGALEQANPGAIALYAAGPMGCQAPREDETPPDDFERARAFGRALAEVAASTAPRDPGAWSTAPGVGLRTVEVPLPPIAFRFSPDWCASPLLIRWLYPTPALAPVSILRLGRDAIVGFPCEISGQLSLEMKRAARARGLRLTATSFAGGYHGYVPPDAYYGRWRYENTLSLHGPHFARFLAELADAATR